MNDWIEWKGGERPVDRHERVDVRLRGGTEARDIVAGRLCWQSRTGMTGGLHGGDIVAYRLFEPPAKPALRVAALEEAVKLTNGDRNASYGPPTNNLRLQYALWEAWKAVAGDKYSAQHDAAIQHIFAKLARIGAGAFKRDNYVDLAAYAAIAFECEALARVDTKDAYVEDNS